MPQLMIKNSNQKDAYSSPWSKKEAILIRIWEVVWNLLIRWLPKPFSVWYRFWLKLFGAKIYGKPFIAPTCRIYAPWLLEIHHKACLATRSEVYNLGPICIKERVTIAQYTYLCNGTHDFESPILPLVVGNMVIEKDVFIGAKAIILPGLHIEEGCIIGAGSILTKDTEPFGIYGGNPAKFIKKRIIKDEKAS